MMEEAADDVEADGRRSPEPEDEEEAVLPTVPRALRCDLARGMERTTPEALILEPGHDAPLIVIPFELEDPTSMPRLAVEAIWLFNHMRCSIEKAEPGMYLHGLNGFDVSVKKDRKDILFRKEADGRLTPLTEMRLQARVYEAHASQDPRLCARYVLLVVRSPLAFSVRQAAMITIKPVGRRMQVDQRGVDERRRVWARLVMHVRSGVPPFHKNADLLRRFEETMDWMSVGEADGFTCMFSAQMAFDWIRMNFRQRYPEARQQLILPGLMEPLDLSDHNLALVNPAFVAQCRRYDAAVERVVASTTTVANGNERPTRRTNNKRRRGGASPPPPPPPDDAGGEEEMMVVEEEDELRVTPCEGLELSTPGERGLPACVDAIELVAPTHMEGQIALVEFQRQVCTFPEAVMLELLRKSMHLPAELMAQIAARMRGQEGVALDVREMRDTLMEGGKRSKLVQILALRDEVWGKQMMTMAREMADAAERFRMLQDFVRMGFALAYTRSTGSDGYTNRRVAAYGRFMTYGDGAESRRECRKCFVQMREAYASEGVEGSTTHRAWQYAMEMVHACDRAAWHLRPDNLFLFTQLMVSDVMLCLNFNGSVVDGAENGIGATLVICDGNRNHRRRYKDRETGGRAEGHVMDKANTTGADNTLNDYKQIVDLGAYAPRFQMEGDLFTELKRVTEMSLIKETCDIYEGLGNKLTLKHAVTETGTRKYSTELKAGGDQQSENCMTAIAWLMTRNTKTRQSNKFQTTREDEHTKQRIQVEYSQVTDGYLLLCTNRVRGNARERFFTMMAVARSIASATNGVNIDDALAHEANQAKAEAARTATDGKVDPMLNGVHTALNGLGAGLFFAALGTTVFAGFMQWTGMLGQIHEARLTSALLKIFISHLDLCRDLLNPDMANGGDRTRFLDMSRARGAAMGLLGIGMRETIEAGRRHESQQMAVERTCLAFKAEGAKAAVAWIMADAMEHMLRLDFFLVMQMLFKLLRVPHVDLDALLAWLDTGEADACPDADAFYQMHATAQGAAKDLEERGLGFMRPYATDVRHGDLTPVEQCLYLTHPMLRATRLDVPFGPEARTQFCERVGDNLMEEFREELRKHAQINEARYGKEVMRAMLENCIDKSFAWPSVLPSPNGAEFPRQFGMGRGATTHALAPLRLILVEQNVGRLAVDLRWLLLVGALSEGQLAQASRFSIVGQLIQRLYQHCVPMELVFGRELMVWLPTQWMGAGYVCPPVLPSTRRTLRRPGREVGTDAPCRSGMVEDLCVAAPRYELARMLDTSERGLPTECVAYEFPHGIWTPALVKEADNHTRHAGVMWRDGRFLCMRADGTEEDITHDGAARREAEEEEPYERDLFLGGRVTRSIRPLCHFFRPGILVRVSDTVWGGVGAFMPASGRYAILPMGLWWTAYEVEERLVVGDAPVRFRATALPEGARLQRDNGAEGGTAPRAGMEAVGELEALYVETVPLGHVRLRMKTPTRRAQRATSLFGASHGGHARRDCETRFAPHITVAVTEVIGLVEKVGGDAWSRCLF
jgi:hypothetical protein